MDLEHAKALLFRQKTYQQVRRWLKALKIPACDRADVAQDIMLAAHYSFATYDPSRSRPERWLNSIAAHVAAHYHSRWTAQRRSRSSTVALDDDMDLADEGVNVEERLILNQQLRVLAQHVEQLKGNAAIVRHADIEEVPMATIAAVYGANLGSAYRWRIRTLEALRAKLESA